MKIYKHLRNLLPLLMILFVPQGMWAQYDGTPVQPTGSGEEADPYLIATAANLYWFVGHVNAGNSSSNAQLTADIVVNDTANWNQWNATTAPSYTWTPIDNYAGKFDGAGHTIGGLYCKNDNAGAGLFSSTVTGAEISNLGIVASYFNGQFAGAICENNNAGSIANCYNRGTVCGVNYAGGVCGNNTQGSITNCYNMGAVNGENYAGGVCGYNNIGDVFNCYNTGAVSGNEAGGICGINENYGDISNCYYLAETPAVGSQQEKSSEQFASGEVAYLLGKDIAVDNPWGQKLGNDNFPVFSNDKVYVYRHEGEDVYTNDASCSGQNVGHEFGPIAGEANGDGLFERTCIHHCGNTVYTIKDALGEGNHLDLIKNAEDKYELADDDLNLSDGVSFASPVNFTVRGVTAYNRLANKDTMTIILPYDVPDGDVNGQPYQLIEFDGLTLEYQTVNDGLKANVPYLIYKNRSGDTNQPLVKPQNNVLVHATTAIDTIRVNDGRTAEFGAYRKEVFKSGDESVEYDFYGYKGGRFLKAMKDITISPFRVAVRLNKPNARNKTKAFSLNSINPDELNVVFHDNITGVKATSVFSELVGKVNVYDVNGRAIRLNVDVENCLDELKDGVYVVNGKKVVVKTNRK